jgi:ABC-type methionine transport system ATPase subunit
VRIRAAISVFGVTVSILEGNLRKLATAALGELLVRILEGDLIRNRTAVPIENKILIGLRIKEALPDATADNVC